MKKLKFLLYALTLCLLLSACGGTPPEPESAAVPDKNPPPSAEDEASLASVVDGPLSEDELADLRLFLSGTRELLQPGLYAENALNINTTLGCFFTSYYEDVRDLDLGKFLAYCGVGEELEAGKDEEEYTAYLSAAGFDEAYRKEFPTLKDSPVPVRRLPAVKVDALLKQYGGIGLDDLNQDWKSILPYSADYDAFYNHTSDFGAGTFSAASGLRGGDLVTLNEEPMDGNRLVLKKNGDSWLVVSHTPETDLFTGSWQDSVSERAVLDVTPGAKAGTYHMVVSWGNGADSTVQWTMDALRDVRGGGLAYQNCVKTEVKFENGTDTTTELRKDGTGSFLWLESGELLWSDDTDENTQECRFVRVNG